MRPSQRLGVPAPLAGSGLHCHPVCVGNLRTGGVVPAIATLALLAGCSSSHDAARPPTSAGRATSTATASSTTRPTPVRCNGDGETNVDDDGAQQGLLLVSELPPARWRAAPRPPCPWALSAGELLAVPSCADAARVAGKPVSATPRNGHADFTVVRPDGIQLDDRIEIFPSRQSVDSIRAILLGPSLAPCYAAAVQRRAATMAGTTVTGIRVSRFAVGADARALGLGFAAVAGYAADPGFVDGVDLTFTQQAGGRRTPVAVRIVTFGAGGLMSTLTLIGPSTTALARFDLATTLRHAAKGFLTMTNSS
ncbi:MAG: hypothetical protein JWM05_1647 [Acidimicrobiales bacterium]|nr:hypothetical protein [Acidimicrobiales bacterium]